MKYIKLFESFDIIPERDFYLNFISNGFEKTSNGMLNNDEVENLTNSDLLKIKSLLGDKYKYTLASISEASNMKNSRLDVYEDTYTAGETFFIVKLRDDWFMVYFKKEISYKNTHTSYYKCDQIDGLLNCLSSIKETHINEKNDINIINAVDNVYNIIEDEVKSSIETRKMVVSGNSAYFFLSNYITPIAISFEKGRSKQSFGIIEITLLMGVERIPCIFLPLYQGIYNSENIHETDFLKALISDSSAVKHEITHLIDYLRYGSFDSSSQINKEIITDKDVKRYFNHSYERNAYFIQGATSVKKQLDNKNFGVIGDFECFMIFMKIGTGHMFDKLSDKNKKKYMSRCYQLFQEFKLIYNK
jgi:hypothetical protein